MPDALMQWDETQKRWRAMYKRRRLQVRASVLVAGATTRDATVVEANRWLRKQQEQIDRELAVGTHRPNEEGYLDELASIQSAIKALPVIARGNPVLESTLAQEVGKLKHREMRIKQALRQEILPPLDDALRNPINVSPTRIEAEATQEATQQIADRLRGGSVHSITHQELKDHDEYIPYDIVEYGEYGVSPSEYARQMRYVDQHNKELADRTLEDRIQNEAGEFAGLQDGLVAHKKEESGAIDEFARGMITQLLNEHGATVPESRKLEYHIDKFLESKKRECQLGSIVPGRLHKIINSIDRYRKWSPIINGNVDRIGTKEHIEAYYSFLVQQVLNKINGTGEGIEPIYAKNLFGDFKMLVYWLVNEEVLKETPRCLQLKSNKYTFPVKSRKPKVIPLPLVRRILDAVTDNPRLKLFVLLTLNCGFGASEIGKLTKDEYNPKEGRIRHKRCKTEKSDKVPVVCYKLWNETRQLLNQELANRKKYPQHPESADYLLVNSNGKPLWSENIETGKSDNITNAFKRLITKLCKNDPDLAGIAYYQLRRTSATLIYGEPEYRALNGLWLGHAPQSVADVSYNVREDTMLDRCLEWLRDRIFDVEPPSEGG